VVHLKGDSLLYHKIRLGWKVFQGASTLDYYEYLQFTAVKSYIASGQARANVIILFTPEICDFNDKLVIVPFKPFQPGLMFVGNAWILPNSGVPF